MSTKTILVVDDSSTIRLQMKQMLSQAGYDVITAENGLQAIELLKHEPCLMILDVVMPELDGYGVCERLEQLGEKYSRLPIVFLTSIDSHALELLGRQYGAYLHKPVDESELLDVVASQLELATSVNVR